MCWRRLEGSQNATTMGYRSVLHLHTWRCQHAQGEVIDYVATAVAGGCTVLGIADHVPTPDGRWDDHRMRMDQLADYHSAIQSARLAHPTCTIFKGLECEYVEEFAGFHRDLLDQQSFDYLIQGQHFSRMGDTWLNSFEDLTTARALQAYAANCIRGMESGLYLFITHPDIFGCCGSVWGPDQAACADEICAAARALQIPLELNGYGLRKPMVRTAEGKRPMYPWPPFWEVAAQHGCEVVCSSDAHRPMDVLAGSDALAELRERFGLQEADVLTRIRARKK